MGLRLTVVHRDLRFDQSPWMEPYIRMNTELQKMAASGFEKDLYKLMNNSVFGKTMENLRMRGRCEAGSFERGRQAQAPHRQSSICLGQYILRRLGSYPGPQEPPSAQSPGVRGDGHSGSLQAPDV